MPVMREFLVYHLIVGVAALVFIYFFSDILEITNEYIYGGKVKDTSSSITGEILFSKENLSKFNGRDNDDDPIYLSILGSVYDVTKGRKHYGKGCSYNFFAGRDASVSFITGDFETYTDNSDDILQLETSEILSLYNWKVFYDKEYEYKGRLIGRFYDSNGLKTDYFLKLDELVEQAKEKKLEEEVKKADFPPCNIEWSETSGTKVWCSSLSGGVQREWSGFPRKYFEPGQSSFRCACVNEKNLNSPLLKPYKNCDPSSDTCFYKVE